MVGVQSTTSWSVALYPVSSSNSRRAATRASSSGPPMVVATLSKPGDQWVTRVGWRERRVRTGWKLCRTRGERKERDANVRREERGREDRGVPMTCLSSGGRYCSTMTVDSGKALVLDLRMAKMATAIGGGGLGHERAPAREGATDRPFRCVLVRLCVRRIPRRAARQCVR